MGGYKEPLHLSFTMALAEMAGFDSNEAYEIAKYDRATDDDPSTDPLRAMNIAKRTPLRDYHFPTEKELEVRRSEALTCKRGATLTANGYRAIGQYMHALEDSFAHRDHIERMFHGTQTDFPWTSPDMLVQMFSAKFEALLAVRQQCLDRSVNEAELRRRHSTALLEVQNWARVESQDRSSDGVRGRWAKLELAVFGSRHQAYTQGAEAAYRAWLNQRQSANWRE